MSRYYICTYCRKVIADCKCRPHHGQWIRVKFTDTNICDWKMISGPDAELLRRYFNDEQKTT